MPSPSISKVVLGRAVAGYDEHHQAACNFGRHIDEVFLKANLD
jgi:hypothetical protein